MAVTLNAKGTSVSSFTIGKGGQAITLNANGYLTIDDGVDTEQPLGYNTIPIYEIDAADTFDLAHAGMMWHKDAGGAVTFTCDNDSTIPQGSTWIVHNDDAEDITIAQGTGVTIAFLASGAAPSTGDVTVSQGGVVTVYKYTDTEYWVWGDDGPFNILTAGSTTDATLRWNGSAWAENTTVTITSTGVVTAASTAGNHTFSVDSATTNADIPVMKLSASSTGTPLAGIGPSIQFEAETAAANLEIGGEIALEATDVTATTEDFDFVFNLMAAGAAATEAARITSTGSIFLPEKADADADVAGYGQIWVDLATPNKLYFTDDAGTDFDITGNVSNTGTPVDNQVAVWTNATTIEGDADFTWTGTALNLRTGADLNIFTADNAKNAILRHDGSVFDIRNSTVDTTILRVDAFGGGFLVNDNGNSKFFVDIPNSLVQIDDGYTLRLEDSTSADAADFQHDGTDFNTTFGTVGTTTDWNITGYTGRVIVSGDFQAAAGRLYFTDSAAEGQIIGEVERLGFLTPNLASADTTRIQIGGGQDVVNISIEASDMRFGGNNLLGYTSDTYSLQTMDFDFNTATFTFYNTGGTDSAAFNHDGTDFNTTFTNTVDWNISGLSTKVNILDADLTVEQTGGGLTTLTVGGPTVRTSNSSDGRIHMFGENSSIKYGAEIIVPSSYIQFGGTTTGGATAITGIRSQVNFDVYTGNQFGIFSSANTDFVRMSHDTTDFNIVGTNTTDINMTSGITAVNLPEITLTTALDETYGGTGQTTLTTGDILYASAANTFSKLALGNAGEVLTVVGTNVAWSPPAVIEYAYSSTVTAADPGAGTIRFDSVTIGSIANAYIDDLDGSGDDAGWLLSNLASGDILTFRSVTDAADYIIASVNGTPTDNTGWWTVPLTLIHTGTIFTDTDQMRVSVEWAGSQAGGGNVSNTGTPVNNQLAIWTDATTIEGDAQLTFDGSELRIYDAGVTDYISISHDALDANFVFGNTTNVTFSGASQAAFESGMTIRTYDSDNSAYIELSANDTVSSITGVGGQLELNASTVRIANGDEFYVRGGGVRFYDGTVLDYLEFIHDGTDMNFNFAGTTDLNINDGTVLKIFDSTDTDNVAFSHDGTDFNIVGTTTTDINITSGITAVNLPEITLTTALDETYGGTGQTTYATGDILYASGANTLTKLAAGTNTHVLTLTGGVPTWAAAPGAGSISGTVADNQIVTGTGASTVDSSANLTFDGTTFAVVGSSTFTTDSATTNADIPVITLRATSTGTPAIGIGPSIEFEAETSAGAPGNVEIGGVLALEATDVTSTSEDFDFVFNTMAAGATAAERMRITSTGNVTATSFNGVALTTGGSAGNFLNETGSYTALTSNATHTGQVTGATALSLDITAITDQPASGAIVATDTILINDGGVLSEATFTQLDTYFNSSLSFGSGTVTSSGTPLNNEVAVFTSGTDIDSDSTFTWDGTTMFATNVTGTNIGGIAQANLLDKSATETVSGEYTFTASPIISAAVPRLYLRDTDATADEGNWFISGANDTFQIATASDAAPTSAVENAITINRAGTAVSNVTINNGDLVLNENLSFDAVTNTIAGIQNQNLLDKTAAETISGVYTHSAGIVITDTTEALALRAGDTSAVFAGDQITFGFDGNNQYQHAIGTRHNSAADTNNAIDFYLWDFGVDTTNVVGTFRALTLDQTGSSFFTNLDISGALTLGTALDEAEGGTGQTTYATGDILYASGANTLAKLAAGTNTHVLTLSGGVPTWAAAPGATPPTTITVANEATDTTCFPLFVTAATGDLGPKTNANLTFNSATGHFTATSKSFLIKHPTKPGKKLQYGSLEGPEHGVYVRGRLTGSDTIELPDYWTALIDPNSITVNLTPIGMHQELYVADIGDNKVIVGGGTENMDFFYTVYAERVDVDRIELEIDDEGA